MIPWMLQAHAVYLYDEKVLITFNYKDGTKTITFDEIAAKDAPEGNGSDLGCFAPQKTSTYESTLRFLFYCKARLTGRVDSNSSGADRRLQQKQGGTVGAAASRMRVPPKARRSRWEPRLGFLFILRGSRRPPCQTLFHRLLLKNAQTKTTVRVDGGSAIA